MSFDQLPNEVATGEWYLDELSRAWRAASGEADDAYANWSGSLTRSDYDAYVAGPAATSDGSRLARLW